MKLFGYEVTFSKILVSCLAVSSYFVFRSTAPHLSKEPLDITDLKVDSYLPHRNCSVLISYEIHTDPAQKRLVDTILDLLSPQNFTFALEAPMDWGSNITLVQDKVRSEVDYGRDSLNALLEVAKQGGWDFRPIDMTSAEDRAIYDKVGYIEWMHLRNVHMAQQIEDICKSKDVIALVGLQHYDISNLLEQQGHHTISTFAEEYDYLRVKTYFDQLISALKDKIHPFVVHPLRQWMKEAKDSNPSFVSHSEKILRDNAAKIVKLLGANDEILSESSEVALTGNQDSLDL